ncbi:hypothetical protein K438DRAFT_2021748 [Mycena galopus ATCC 62051]|nr:hypothetical protein K438DRAFT_2021748 [Mycena galopus ATCC 62051]
MPDVAAGLYNVFPTGADYKVALTYDRDGVVKLRSTDYNSKRQQKDYSDGKCSMFNSHDDSNLQIAFGDNGGLQVRSPNDYVWRLQAEDGYLVFHDGALKNTWKVDNYDDGTLVKTVGIEKGKTYWTIQKV